MDALEDPAFLFRRANEIVRERAAAFGVEGHVPFICECRDARCLGRVEMSLEEYGGVSARPDRAAIAPGHEDPHEQIVEQTNRFAVVERQAQAASSRRSFRQ